MIAWASYEKLVGFTDAQLDLWKSRGVDGFVVQTRYLDEIGGSEMWTGDPTESLSGVIIEGTDVHEKQRTLRDNQFAQRCHARGLTVYLGIYLSNYHNLSTPLKVWNDDAGWSQIIPIVRGAAGAAKLLGMDGIATDSEMYRDESQTWNWDYPGVTQTEATVRSLARQRGREFMEAVLAGFPNVEIINYRLEVPGSWEERVQQQVNGVVGVWDKSVFPDFWGGIVDAGGFSAIYFFDPIFYKSWHIRSGWDEALEYNVKGVRQTLSQRWANWEYASPRFFLSPFAWIDPGPSAGSFDDARAPEYVARQLDAFHRWGQGNTFGLYTQHIDDFDYTPYVSAMQAASTPDAGGTARTTVPTTSSREDVIKTSEKELEVLITADPELSVADDLESILEKMRNGLDELAKIPPNRQAAARSIEGAIDDIETAVDAGLLPAASGNELMDTLVEAVRLFADQAVAEAVARSADPAQIAEALESLADGDAQRATGAFKDAVNKYRDALSKAEGA